MLNIGQKITKIDPKMLKIRQIDPKISKKSVSYSGQNKHIQKVRKLLRTKTMGLPLKILLLVLKLTGKLLPSFRHNFHLCVSVCVKIPTRIPNQTYPTKSTMLDL